MNNKNTFFVLMMLGTLLLVGCSQTDAPAPTTDEPAAMEESMEKEGEAMMEEGDKMEKEGEAMMEEGDKMEKEGEAMEK